MCSLFSNFDTKRFCQLGCFVLPLLVKTFFVDLVDDFVDGFNQLGLTFFHSSYVAFTFVNKHEISQLNLCVAFHQQLCIADVGSQGIDLTGFQHQYAVVEAADRNNLNILRQLSGDQIILQRAVLCADFFACKIFGFGVLAALALCYQYALTSLLAVDVKGVGKLHALFTFFGLCKACDGNVCLTGRDGSLYGTEVHGADLQLYAQLFSDVFCKLNVRADVFFLAAAQVLKFQRSKVRAGCQHQFAGFFDFVQTVLVECFNAKELFCGDNFTFGARAAGNVERLRELCAPLGIGVHIVPMAQYSGQTVSSTRIRAALEEGRLDDANAMLGTPYAIDWPVVHGKGIGSGKLGTPTLNQNYPTAALQPCAGVYLTRIYLDGQWRPAATGIGKRPTVDSSENAAVTCETFVPDFSGNVYGQQPVLEFHKYFCPVRKFNSMDELAALIHHAADESKAYFAALNGAK